jgi:putative selenium metabolism protein SsnA
MSSILIKNGTVVTGTGKVLVGGAVLIDGKKVAGVYPKTPKVKAAKVIDATNQVVMPGYICAHHHLYSTQARGMCPPGKPAKNFVETLERLWWRLDYSLNREDVLLSALVPLIECIKNGTTTIIDHHASPTCRDGSLEIIRDAVEAAGIRASLCYEVSDRNVKGGGLAESERFLATLAEDPSELVTGLVGLHASFTVGDETAKECVRIAKKYDSGCHIHVAEDKSDRDHCVKKFGVPVVKRLEKLGMLGKKTILVHCIHIDEEEMAIIKRTGSIVVHNPESNMNNAVGVSKALKMLKKGILVGLGTDGMSSDMPAQMRAAYLLHRLDNMDPRVAFCEAPQMLLGNNREIVRRTMGIDVGTIEKGKPADVIVVDYDPPTPLGADNFLGHLIFGMVDAAVDTTIVNGRVLMEKKKIRSLNAPAVMAACRKAAPKMWKRLRDRFA